MKYHYHSVFMSLKVNNYDSCRNLSCNGQAVPELHFEFWGGNLKKLPDDLGWNALDARN